uniref:Flavin-containing monooxygenase n=2 Tax=Ixodes ricinus TaxID=34613 RepID=A0A147BGF9_IXORI
MGLGKGGRKRIAIVGGGSAGIASAKSCLEEDLEPVVFERTDALGGLWRYREKAEEGVPNLMKATIINTCKEMSSFSDFPPPREFANYMHHTMLVRYFELYADHFGVTKHIRFNTDVVKVSKSSDYDETGRWVVTVKTLGQDPVTETFDGVLVCSGHHVYPHVPTFKGLDKFKGTVFHTHDYKLPDAYRDKRILIIGVGNSGADVAVDLCPGADKVYLSTRRGCWVIRRVGFWGIPADSFLNRRTTNLFNKWAPEWLVNLVYETYSNEAFDHRLYRLKPKHRWRNQHPTINDALPNGILSGRIIVKGDVEEFTETGVVFKDEEGQEVKLDVVILATGYLATFPFLDQDIHKTEKNKVCLYKYVFPPHLPHPTLGFIGLLQLLGGVFPAQEAQSRWYALLMRGKLSLPSPKEMQAAYAKWRAKLESRYVESLRHTFQADWVDYMDEITSLYGAKPDLWRMFWRDNSLFWKCFWEPCLPYQYRLQGPHTWSGARDAMMSMRTRLKGPLDTRKMPPSSSCKNSKLRKGIPTFLWVFGAAALLVYLASLLF